MAKRSNNAPLDALRVMLNTCSIPLQPLTHQINALPQESDLEYYFVSSRYMSQFAPYYRRGEPFKNLKLVNYDRPAISLNFYSKHKYTIDRDVTAQDAELILRGQRDELFNNSFLNQPTPSQQQHLLHIDRMLRQLRQNPDQFQLAISNYHHYYRYWYCSFRYFEDSEQTKTASHNEHMLKHTQRTDERSREQRVSERLNVIFIHADYITRPVPYDNKLIDRELETYPDSIKFGKATLYVKSVE